MRRVVVTIDLAIRIHQISVMKEYYGLLSCRVKFPTHYQALHPRESKSLVYAQKVRKKTTILL